MFLFHQAVMITFSEYYGKLASVEKKIFHDIRRTAITNWARELPIQVVQTLAGHSSITTTRKYYLAVRPEDFESASKVLNLVLNRTQSD